MSALIPAFNQSSLDSEKKVAKEYKSMILTAAKGEKLPSDPSEIMKNSEATLWDTSNVANTKNCLNQFIDTFNDQITLFQKYSTSTIIVQLKLNSPCVNEGRELIIQTLEAANAMLDQLNRPAIQP